ncbi:MAG: hypothetical protein JXP73_07145 [Deltaproteobacteria bacterium]|nr:hypothetical protein [Deltaproteobacteria bacterium]
MRVPRKQLFPLVASAVFAIAAGCGSGDSSTRDAAPDQPKVSPDAPAVIPDGPLPADAPQAPDASLLQPDATTPVDGAPDSTTAGLDGARHPLDGGAPHPDAHAGEAGSLDGGGTTLDGGTVGLDAGASASDVAQDTMRDGFVPGAATPIVVNSSNTADYSLADGTWKVFYFDGTAGQLYCVSELSGIVRGYVSTSPSVSPTNHQYATDSNTGSLAFVATAAQRYYLAVAVSGGGASGWFQVADGGQLLALGANSVTLPAPDMDNYYFFRFPVSKGHSYSISVTGPAATTVGLGLSPYAERATNGQFFKPMLGYSGPLPITNEPIPDTSVALSYSGYYFFFLHVYSAMNVTVTLAQTS